MAGKTSRPSPLRLVIKSDIRGLAHSLRDKFRGELGCRCIVTDEAQPRFEVRHRSYLPAARLRDVLKILRPMEPEVVVDESLRGADLLLLLGDGEPLDNWHVHTSTDADELAADIQSDLKSMGFWCARHENSPQLRDEIFYGGATPFARNAVLWLLASRGIRPKARKAWGDDDRDIFIKLVDPAMRDVPFAERFPVEIVSDDPRFAADALDRLLEQGFSRPKVTLVEPTTRKSAVDLIGLDPGPLAKLDADIEIARLLGIADAIAHSAKIDLERYPVRRRDGDSRHPVLYLPVRVCRSGRLRPYAGAFPERFRIQILTDDRNAGAELRKVFKSRGFHHVTRRTLNDVSGGFRIYYGGCDEPEIVETVRETVEDHMNSLGAHSTVTLGLLGEKPKDSFEIVIEAPSGAFVDGSLARETENPARFNVSIHGGDTALIELVQSALHEVGFGEARTTSREGEGQARLAYGGAPHALLERIRSAVEDKTGILLPLDKAWPITDRDIWLVLPDSAVHHMPTPITSPSLPIASTGAAVAQEPSSGTFLKVIGTTIAIGDRILPRRADAKVDGNTVADKSLPYCIDGITGETLFHLATAVQFCEPCALEGATSTSKTSAILYLAGLLGQKVFRLNLNGQTDTGELIGRYVPVNEGGWRFQEGLLPRAMKEGHWLLLDEVNLAEPAVAERLNSVLEETPTLVLSEHDNELVVPHDDFRIFATLNPAGTYAGRRAMSPAFRDRWQAWRHVPRPGEAEFAALIRLLVFGEQPSITVDGRQYCGVREKPYLPRLGVLREIEALIAAIARFHASVEAAADSCGGSASPLGVERTEPYVFTRRGLLSMLRFIDVETANAKSRSDKASAVFAGIERYYVGRVTDGADRTAVRSLAQAAGITPTGWEAAS